MHQMQLFSFIEVLNIFGDFFPKLHFYANDKIVQTIKEKVVDGISSFLQSILMTNRWVI